MLSDVSIISLAPTRKMPPRVVALTLWRNKLVCVCGGGGGGEGGWRKPCKWSGSSEVSIRVVALFGQIGVDLHLLYKKKDLLESKNMT